MGVQKPGFPDLQNRPPGPKNPPQNQGPNFDPGGWNIGPRGDDFWGVKNLVFGPSKTDPPGPKSRTPRIVNFETLRNLKSPRISDSYPESGVQTSRSRPQKPRVSSSARREEFKFLNSPHMKWGSLRWNPHLSYLPVFQRLLAPDSLFAENRGSGQVTSPGEGEIGVLSYPPPFMTDIYPIGDWSFGGPEATNTRMVCDMAYSNQKTAHAPRQTQQNFRN